MARCIAIAGLVCLMTGIRLEAFAVRQTTIHVSPAGDDRAAGADDQPVATLKRAQQLARQARRDGQTVVVVLNAGTYYLPETLVFTPEDSGTREAPMVWQAAEGATPVLSGGRRLSLRWQPSSLRPGVFEANTPANLQIDQLWVNGRPMWMARFPNRQTGAGLNVFDTWKLDHRLKKDVERDPLAPDRIARWRDPAGAYLHAMHPYLWGGIHWRVRGKKPDGSLDLEGGTQNNRGSGIHGVYRIIENVFEELDQPGEWFHDRKTSTLYLYAPADVDLNSATVEVAELRHALEVRGSETPPVRWLQFKGLTLRHTARTFMDTREPMLRSDWTVYRGGAVVLDGTEDCELSDCTLEELGGNAIFVSNYNRRLSVRGCLIREVGGSGVSFVGDPGAVRDPLLNYDQRLPLDKIDRTPGPKTGNYPADCVVEDCLIYRTGRVEKQTAGVGIDMARDITVRHCSIYDMPRAGINIGSGCWGGHVIEFCDVFDTVKETGDHGSFNSWGRDRFWPGEQLNDDECFAANRNLPFLDAVKPIVLRNNRWRCDHGWDIDLDDGSSNYHIYNNLCLRGGIKNREGFGRIVENNIILRNGFHPHVWYKHSGDIFRRNIVESDAYAPARMPPPPWGAEMDRNLVHVVGRADASPARELAEQSGRDANSIVADAMFVDPASGDFRVRPSSPALKLGFVNFEMDRFGVQKPSLRAVARTPMIGATSAPQPSRRQISDWHGAQVKTMETVEEASSIGVALADGGVLVLEVAAGSEAEEAGLRRGDLIVSAGGLPVGSVRDLPAAPPGRVVVVRDQRRMSLPAR